jgi:hypothetical protein
MRPRISVTLQKKDIKEVSKMALKKKQMEAVQAQVPAIGLIMAYYSKFGEDALQVAKEYFTQFGKMLGENAKKSLKLTKTDANAVAAVLNECLKQFEMHGICKVEGNKIIAETKGFCPIMEAVKMLNAPWDKIDVYCSWPAFGEMARAVNPNAEIDVVEARHKGDKSCKHVFTIP